MDSPANDQPPVNSARDLSGRTLGNYRLLHRLGVGGMAEVYLAEQPSLQRQVAVKILRQDLALQDDYVKRFQNEARAVAALVHANIVQIYEVGVSDGIHFIAQEYVPGQNLKQCVSRLGPLPIPRVVSILRQIAAALGKAAQRNIVHRDIKPENILLMPGGEVKVADFGLARVVDTQQVDLTQAGLTMGTPLYMSPEQVEGRPLDHRSDLYACGATAFYMLTGRPPFQGETPLSVAVQHLQNAPPDLRELRPDAPAALRDVVEQLLAKKPQDRIPSAAELLRHLRSLPQLGAHDGWPMEEELEGWDPQLASSPTEPLEATQQLQVLLQTRSIPIVGRSSRSRWLAAMGSATLVGGLLAWNLSRPPLAAIETPATSEVPRKADAEAQFYYAVVANSPDAWQSVAKYHDPADSFTNRYYAHRAMEQLASLYLQRADLVNAQQVYAEMTQTSEQEFKALGTAGQAIVADRRGDTATALRLMSDAMSNPAILPTYMVEQLQRIANKPR
jgi:serine/threonine-protein kinase